LEVENYLTAFRPLRELYAHTPATGFGPLALKAVREKDDRARVVPEPNQRPYRPHQTLLQVCGERRTDPRHRLPVAYTVSGLWAGRSAAVEREPVAPVPDEVVDATLPRLNRHVAGLVRFQRLTGCRPGEACRVRMCEIDTTGDVWMFTPKRHKTSYRGKRRVISIGPKAQALLRGYISDDAEAFLFSPARAVKEYHAGRSEKRATKRYPSHMKRNAEKRVRKPSRPPAEKYTTASYGRAIRNAVKTINRRAKTAAGEPFDPLPSWHPNRLRHTYGQSHPAGTRAGSGTGITRSYECRCDADIRGAE
jgi:integrase